jgi:hypothetical protein
MIVGYTVGVEITITSITSDGFTYSWTNTTGRTWGFQGHAYYFASGQVTVGNGVQGDASISAGFKPEAVVYGSVQTDDLTLQTGVYVSYGAGVPGFQRVSWCGGGLGSGSARRYDTGVIRFSNDDGTTLIDKATQTITTTGANLSWTSGTGGRHFGWIAWGKSSTAAHPECKGEGQIYRLVRY